MTRKDRPNWKKLKKLTKELGKPISNHEYENKTLKMIELIFDNSDYFAEIIDRDGNLIYASPALREMVKGYRGKEPEVGKKCYKENHGFDEHCEFCPAFKALEKGEPECKYFEFRELGMYKMRAIPLFDNGVSAVLIFAIKEGD